MPPDTHFLWTDEAEAKLAARNITPEDFEALFLDKRSWSAVSDSTGRPMLFGWTPAGCSLAIVYEESLLNRERYIVPVTAYDIES